MKTARKLTALLCALVLCVSLSVPAFAYTAEEQYDNLMAIVDLIRQVAVDSSMSDDPLARGLKTLFEEDPEAYEKLMSSMLSSYDRYSNYVPAGQYDVSYPSNASYVGVGVTLEQYGEDVRIAAVTEGGSAARCSGQDTSSFAAERVQKAYDAIPAIREAHRSWNERILEGFSEQERREVALYAQRLAENAKRVIAEDEEQRP